jgi:hypothetical protein
MGGLFLILPIVAFDLWLACTTGQRQLARWREQKNWRHLGLAAAAGLLLAVWLAFFFRFNGNDQLRVQGFPIPDAFLHLDGTRWRLTPPQPPQPVLGRAANFLTGLVAPLIPFKIGEFLKIVKEELK